MLSNQIFTANNGRRFHFIFLVFNNARIFYWTALKLTLWVLISFRLTHKRNLMWIWSLWGDNNWTSTRHSKDNWEKSCHKLLIVRRFAYQDININIASTFVANSPRSMLNKLGDDDEIETTKGGKFNQFNKVESKMRKADVMVNILLRFHLLLTRQHICLARREGEGNDRYLILYSLMNCKTRII